MVLSNFNSIKVRLKQPAAEIPAAATKFQFHKGTIKTGSPRIHLTVFPNFNSIKVRLKPDKADLLPEVGKYFNSIKVRLKQPAAEIPAAATKFQFHKGTIKTHHSYPGVVTLQRFQFHKGTIKTCKSKVFCICKLYFNSIKVRLKLSVLMFMSTLFVFQFHKGTIKT